MDELIKEYLAWKVMYQARVGRVGPAKGVIDPDLFRAILISMLLLKAHEDVSKHHHFWNIGEALSRTRYLFGFGGVIPPALS